MMITRTTQIHAAVSLAVFIGSAVLVAVGWVYINQAGVTLEEQVKTVASESQREQQFTELSRLADTTTAAREELSNYILHRDDVPDFVTSGEIMAADLGVEYTTDSLKEVEIEGDYDQLEVQFSMEGREGDVRNMLHALEHVPYHGSVTQIELDRSELTLKGTVRMKVKLVVTLAEEV